MGIVWETYHFKGSHYWGSLKIPLIIPRLPLRVGWFFRDLPPGFDFTSVYLSSEGATALGDTLPVWTPVGGKLCRFWMFEGLLQYILKFLKYHNWMIPGLIELYTVLQLGEPELYRLFTSKLLNKTRWQFTNFQGDIKVGHSHPQSHCWEY